MTIAPIAIFAYKISMMGLLECPNELTSGLIVTSSIPIGKICTTTAHQEYEERMFKDVNGKVSSMKIKRGCSLLTTCVEKK